MIDLANDAYEAKFRIETQGSEQVRYIPVSRKEMDGVSGFKYKGSTIGFNEIVIKYEHIGGAKVNLIRRGIFLSSRATVQIKGTEENVKAARDDLQTRLVARGCKIAGWLNN